MRRKARLPGGVRVYAVGDVHGRADLLERLHGLVAEDAARAPAVTMVLVYLGDYVDRGPDSRAVVDALVRRPLAGFDAVHIKGNHEDFLLTFLEDASVGEIWLMNGGGATLASYGVEAPAFAYGPAPFEPARAAFAARLPADHLAFLRALAPRHAVGDYLFVHAGVRPGVPLAAQRGADLMWIREPFLDSDDDFGCVVVHGHTPAAEPVVRANRIGIDTGAVFTDRLTCLVLDGPDVRFLHT